MKKRYLSLILGMALLGAGCAATTPEPETAPFMPPALEVEGEAGMPEGEDMPDIILNTDLNHVDDGEGSGVVVATWDEDDSSYRLFATFSDLPELEEDFFYEGWVVRAEPLSVISTGALEPGDVAQWVNDFSSDENLTDHVRYVLTLEPDDGDPAPAEHVLEGTLE